MKKFWEQQEWLDKTKESNEDFYNTIINGKEIEIEEDDFILEKPKVCPLMIKNYVQ